MENHDHKTDFVTAVVDQFSAGLHRYLLRHLRDAHHARDLAQEVYLRLLRVGNTEHIQDRQAYLYRVASHVVYEFRMRARQSRVSFDSNTVDAWAEQATGGSEENLDERLAAQQQLEQLLGALPPMCRTVFLLQKQEGLTYEEVAARLGISVHAVQRYLFRALAALRSAQWS